MMNRRQQIQALKERLQRVAGLSPNKVCSECPESTPTWASIIQPPPPQSTTSSAATGGEQNRLGVLCCYKCSILHFQLGKEVCTVKSIKMVEEWTEEEIQILETSGGNQIVNAVYEAGLNKAAYNKWIVLDDEQEEDTNRKEFIQNKYQHLEYFDPVLYKAHSLHRKKSTSRNNNNRPSNRTARRCRSFDHENNTKLEKQRRELVRKPMRRRSQSCQEDLNKMANDDGGESTDDDMRLSYNLPGHLKRMSVSDQHTTNGRRRGGAGGSSKRRSSMPGLMNNSSNRNAQPRRQRRASKTSSVAVRSTDILSLPSKSALGYGDDNDDDTSMDGSMDATDRRSNRRRDSSTANSHSHSPGRVGGGGGGDLMTNSTSRWRSGRRRTSLPSVGLGPAPMSSSSDYDSCGTYQSFSSSSCSKGAPKMPTRCISSDSGEDDPGNETDDTGFMSPAPVKINDRIPRRVRRMSMPGMSSGDEDDRTAAAQQQQDHHAYSPSIPRLTRFDDLRATNKSKSMYGMKLPYGFKNTGGGGAGTDSDSNSSSQKQAEKSKPTPLKPTRMPQQYFNGGPAFKRCGTAPGRPPPKLLLDSDSAMSSCDELSYGFPSPCPNKKTQTRRKRTARANRRTMRRCSTGGALDAKLNRKVPSPQSSFDASSLSDNTKSAEDCNNAGKPSVNDATATLKNLKNLAMGSTLSSQKNVKEADLGYEDVFAPNPQQQNRDDDELPSLSDLGYGGIEGGHESMASLMSIETTGSATGYGADMSCAHLGRYFDGREDEERTHHLSPPGLSRMQRRSSTGTTTTSSRRGSTGIARRRGSTNGACTTPPRYSRRRASNRGAAGGDEGLLYHLGSNPGRRSSVGAYTPSRSGSMLGTGPGTLMRADSLSSLGSEVSANAALLYAGDKKYFSGKSDTKNSDMKDDSNLSSASPVSVALVGYDSALGKALGVLENDPADSTFELGTHEDHHNVQDEASSRGNQSRKDYWKSKLHEHTDHSSSSTGSRQDDGPVPSYQPRRTRRRKSMTTACA